MCLLSTGSRVRVPPGSPVRNRRQELGLHTKAPIRNAETIKRLTELLIEAAKPKRIIMFGSQARGDAGEDSDLDVIVVEEGVSDRAAEMVRLNRLLRSLDMAVDLLVVTAEKFNYWCDTPGNVYFEAATDGEVLYEAA
jgi:predicted nucleotidyltransferase